MEMLHPHVLIPCIYPHAHIIGSHNDVGCYMSQGLFSPSGQVAQKPPIYVKLPVPLLFVLVVLVPLAISAT